MSRKSPESLDKAAVICKELLDENKKELLDEKKVPHDVSLMLAQVYDLQGKADDARKLQTSPLPRGSIPRPIIWQRTLISCCGAGRR